MKVVNLLEFLNNAKRLKALNYAKCDSELVNFLDLMVEDEQFTNKIDLGVMFVTQTDNASYVLVDGLNRLLSLSLLLHSICECYKKTTEQNEKAIKTIRKKYLISNSHSKLMLNEKDDILYNKIINGERLSGHEKDSSMFKLLHAFWSQIKNENLQAANIFAMLKKISVTLVDTENVSQRDLYYKLNGDRDVDQLLLINDYLKDIGLENDWNTIRDRYFPRDNDVKMFLKDFFTTKFNFKTFDDKRLYEIFVNYFETMLRYLPEDVILRKMIKSASLYFNILNVNFKNDDVKHAFIQIKKASGDDTYAYILQVYEDLIENNISESTFIEILNTIADYVKNRKNSSDNNISFNELIQYLNAFITCK